MNPPNPEDIISEFMALGYSEETISNEIKAGELNKKNLRTIYSEIKKKYPPLETSIKLLKSNTELPKNTKKQICVFPINYSLDDNLVPHSFEVKFEEIHEKYFFEDESKIEENFRDHLLFLASKFREKYRVEISKVNDTSENEIFIVGRLYVEEKNEQERYFLEDPSGKIQLNFEKIENYAVFPGQIIMVRGTSDSLVFTISEIFTETFETAPNILTSTSNHKILIGVVHGPFTAISSQALEKLDYTVFLQCVKDLMRQVNVLIIIGPIVDSENEMIKEGNIFSPSLGIEDGTYEDVFMSINLILKNFALESQCKVIYVPHFREVSHVFPLPMPGLNETFDTNFACPSSPSFLKIDKIPIYVIPYDYMGDVNSNLTHKGTFIHYKIDESAKSVLHQFCCLPTIMNTLPVEYSKFDKFRFDVIPNIIITTTKLRLLVPEIFSGTITIKVPNFNETNSDGKFGYYTIINISKHFPTFLDGVGVKIYRF